MPGTKLSCYEPLPNERQDSFEKFIIYRNLPPHERSLTKAAEQIAMNKDEQSVKKLKTSLGNLCTKWCWVERVKIYDADQQLKIIKKRSTTFDQLSNILLDNVEGLIKYANNLLGEVIKNPVKDNGEPYSLITRIKMSKDVSALLKEAHELLCNLCGRPSTYTSMAVDGLIGINADVTTEHKGFENLIEAFDAGKKQWDKNKE
ncbi:MAG: hypothetical protein II453_00185 [Alphaproteobacteria bacterium]|nr:hypothetical protein [Alphaproteobacteria bacterium]